MPMQRSFAGGELSPALAARADQAKYAAGVKTCRNMQVMHHGGVQNRAGTVFIGEAKIPTHLLKFVDDDTRAYLIEFGVGYFRFYKDGARVRVSGVAAWADATAYVVGDLVANSGVNYYCIQGHTSAAANDEPGAGANEGDYWYALEDDIFELPVPYTFAAGTAPRLQYAQDGNVLTITHPSYAPRELRRTSETGWVLSEISGGGSGGPSVPTPTNVVPGGTAGTEDFHYAVVAINAITGEASFRSVSAAAANRVFPSPGDPIGLSWDITGDGPYRFDLYRENDADQQGLGRIAAGIEATLLSAGTYGFSDTGFAQNFEAGGGPIDRALFGSAGDQPAAVEHYQQRRVFAGSTDNPQSVWASRVGSPENFTVRRPIEPDDSVSFTLSGRNAQTVRYLINLKRLIILTSTGEWVVKGDESGTLVPTAINADQEGHIGAALVRPVVIGNTVLYVQARGSTVRDLAFNFEADGYVGKDLSIFASHLFEGYTIAAMDFAQLPHSIAWCVRSDGTLLGLTYLREHEIWAWHRHDTADGRFADVCVLPEGTEDAVYCLMARDTGAGINTIERLHTRLLRPVLNAEGAYLDFLTMRQFAEDSVFVDAAVTRNGWEIVEAEFGAGNGMVLVLSLFGSGGWTVTDTLTLTATLNGAATGFTADDVGRAFDVDMSSTYPAADPPARLRITPTVYVSATVMRCTVDRDVPTDLRASNLTSYARAVAALDGLDHLEGLTVAVLGDGNSVGTFTVASGAITLPRPYAITHVGLPITAQLETLDLDYEGTNVREKKKSINAVTLLLKDTRGISVGPDADHLYAAKPDPFETDYDTRTQLTTGDLEVAVTARKRRSARVVVQQTEPLPVTVLGLIPHLEVGG